MECSLESGRMSPANWERVSMRFVWAVAAAVILLAACAPAGPAPAMPAPTAAQAKDAYAAALQRRLQGGGAGPAAGAWDGDRVSLETAIRTLGEVKPRNCVWTRYEAAGPAMPYAWRC